MSVAEAYGFDFSKEPCESFPFSRFPCRKCLPCLQRRQQEWVTRLTEELRQYDCNYYLTFTYDEDRVPVDEAGQYCFDSDRIIKLHRDLRKRYEQGFFKNPCFKEIKGSPEFFALPKDQKIRYYLTSEYGPTSTERSHYHAVYYNMGIDLYTAELLFKLLWPDGFIRCLPAWPGSAGYISKYLVKDNLESESYTDDTRQSPISIMSKGLGKSYIKRMKSFHEQDPYNRTSYQYHGQKSKMSRYYRQKIFSEDVRDRLYHDYMNETGSYKDKYEAFRLEHPMLYCRLLEERKKYFNDQREAARWQQQKKHNNTI